MEENPFNNGGALPRRGNSKKVKLTLLIES